MRRIEVFNYLECLIAMDNSDEQAIETNIRKVPRCWAQLSKVLIGEIAENHVCSQFYRTTVQAVLLFRSETWNLIPSALKSWRVSMSDACGG